MKTTNSRRSPPVAIIAFCLIAAIGVLLLPGCSAIPQKIGELNETMKAIEALGLKEVSIPGRVTYTRYVNEGSTSTLTHTNPALAGPIVIVRERPAP